MNNEKPAAYLEIVLAATLLSLSGPFTRWANLPSGAMTFMRTAVPSLVLGIWLIVRHLRGGEAVFRFSGWLLLASLLNASRMLMFFEAYRLTSIGNAVIALYTWPAFAMVLGFLIMKEAFSLRDLALLILAFAGMVIVYSGAELSLEDQDFLGMSLMLLSSILYALTLILIRRENVDRLTSTFWQNIVGALVFAPAFLSALGSHPADSWMFASLNGLIVGTLAFSLLFSAFQKISAAAVGHISYLEVVFALLWSRVIFSEEITWRHLVGGGLIVASMIIRAELVRRSTARQPVAS